QDIGRGLSLLQRDLKMLFSGLPLTCRRCGDTRDCLREAGDRPKHYSSRVYQFANKRVQLRSFLLLAEHDEALNNKRKHKPLTCGVRFATVRQLGSLFLKES